MSKNPRGKNSLAAVKGGDRTRTILIQVAVAVVLIALIAGIGISIALKHNKKNDVGAHPAIAATAPVSADGITGSMAGDGGLLIGKPSAKVTVRLISDFQCPICKQFETANGQTLVDAVNNGTAKVDYNFIAFLDQSSSGTRYSSRSANAAYCVGTSDPTKFQKWFAEMYQQQPAEGSTGLPDSKLVQIAQDAGYTDPSIAQCITSDKYDGFVHKTTTDAFSNPQVQGTPTIFVNGKNIPLSNELLSVPGSIKPAIEAAAQ
ncbi:DsbA family protein [Nocardia alni]|uniref:DsbA family protein n=1 Tax=Nocardia alni TaxID=2815723 RepID=UPI001C247F5C|nr:thioredoxin domain-containing protein [Nocardia alni]